MQQLNSQGSAMGSAMITGASSGIGATYADRLARRGYDLILVARDQARLEALAAKLRRETGVHIDVLPADLTNKTDLRNVEQRLRSDSKINVLVNNAGVGAHGGLIDADPDQLEAMIDLNIVAVMRLATAVIPGFVARKRGTLINVSSVLALAPELFNGSYSGTKAYVLNFTQALHGEVHQHGVRVQAVLPGATRTEIWDRAGGSVDALPAAMLMEVDEMVDAALAGLDCGELVTIPSLPEIAQWDTFNQVRQALAPDLSKNHAAARYQTNTAATISNTVHS